MASVTRRANALLLLSLSLVRPVFGQTAAEKSAMAGDTATDPGPRATLSGSTKPAAVKAAVKKVADWELARMQGKYSQDWTIATLYAGFMAASSLTHDPKYAAFDKEVGEHWNWTLGPRRTHADDQAIGQTYLELYQRNPNPIYIESLRKQFNEIMNEPDPVAPAKPIWWWCDALFMAPPVWARLSAVTHDPKYNTYMDHQWHITDNLLWDKDEHLFYRDASYFQKREKGGQKIFWSRGNGWVMGGLVRVLDVLPKTDPSYPFYVERLKEMSAKIITIQRPDGLWSPGLLDTPNYELPEVSGSAFFVYALAYGINHRQLDAKTYRPVVDKAWKSLVSNIYADGRLGSIQPVGAAPGAFSAGSSYAFGTGAFMMAGSEVAKLR